MQKLHLGCGDDVRQGYINIDRFDLRAKGVIAGDVTDLGEFDDESVDEILTIALIEHLNYQELDTALTEWFRVLKFGGYLQTECPDMLDAAKRIVNEGLTDGVLFDIWGQYWRPWDKDWNNGSEILEG